MKYFDCIIIFGISFWGTLLLCPLLMKIFNNDFWLSNIMFCISAFCIGGFIMHILIKIKERWL